MEENKINDKKICNRRNNRALSFILTAILSMGIGAGGVYLKNKPALEYAKKYPTVISMYDFMDESEALPAKQPSKEEQIESFLKLYGLKFSGIDNSNTLSSDVKLINNVNSSPTACGCGFKLKFDSSGRLIFKNVDENMPAYEQGFRTDDIIISIDRETVNEYNDAAKIKGKQGTKVTLLIERDGVEKEMLLTRCNDSAKSAKVESKLYNDILYVRVNAVYSTIISQVEDVLKKDNYKSIIFDLRDNPGGETDTIVRFADLFIDKADVKMYEYNGAMSSYSTTDGVEIEAPIVILVNENTASSAEILTSLLKQYADATIIGTTTYGKGVFQSFGTFEGVFFHYVTGYFTVGDWECWQGKGIAPDIEIEMDSSLIGTENDIQLNKALELLS